MLWQRLGGWDEFLTTSATKGIRSLTNCCSAVVMSLWMKRSFWNRHLFEFSAASAFVIFCRNWPNCWSHDVPPIYLDGNDGTLWKAFLCLYMCVYTGSLLFRHHSAVASTNFVLTAAAVCTPGESICREFGGIPVSRENKGHRLMNQDRVNITTPW
jgi:hypothetical protein